MSKKPKLKRRRLDKVVLPADPANTPLSIPQWCLWRGYSLPTFYKMRAAGQGPAEHCPPGLKMVRISPEATRRWEERWTVERIEDNPVRVALREKGSRAGKRSQARRAA
jgi:hypothetical protein